MKILIVVLLSLWNLQAQSQDLFFDNITEQDMTDIANDFTGVFAPTSVSGANTLGSIFGFELGLVGSGTKAEKIERIVKREDPTADIPFLPSGGLLGRLTVPFGLTVEALLIPEVGDDDFKFQNTSLALMWTPTETLLSFLPLSLATKVHFTQTSLKFKQTDPGIPGGTVQVDSEFKNTITGIQFLVSKNLLLVEPYAGVGFIQGDGELSVKGSAPAFNFTASDSASKKVDGAQFFAGAELKLLIFKIGAEYSKHLDVNRYSLKLAAYF